MKNTTLVILHIFISFLSWSQSIDPQNYFPIFEDQFNNNRNVWMNNGRSAQDLSQIENGAYHLECYLTDDGCTQWWPHFDLESNRDFVISFELQWLNPSEPVSFDFEMGADLNETQSYAFGLRSDGYFQFSQFANNEWKDIIPLKACSSLSANKKNKIGIKKIGSLLSFFINDVQVHQSPFGDFQGDRFAFVLWGKQQVWIDNVKVGYLHNLTSLIQMDVQEKINDWQKKDEFEKTMDYENRVNERSREKKIIEFQDNTIARYKILQARCTDFSDITIGAYDADNESYLLSSKTLGPLIVSVPLTDAPYFKNNFSNLQFRNPDFYIKDNQFKLAYFDIIGPNGRKFFFDSKEKLTYANTNISYSFQDIELKVNNQENIGQTTIIEENISYGKSDVDVNIPKSEKNNAQTFAVVIGNEQYAKEIKVDFALNDARIFKQYLEKTMGIPSNNIQLLENATFGQILDVLKWLTDITKAYQGEASIIFYYAGHGVPDEQTKSAYLLPVDGNSQNTLSAIKLDEIYGQLSAHPTQSTVVFLDACFSGSARSDSQMLAKGRGVKIKPKSEALTGNLVVFSATTGDETALPYSEKQHGMFTYYLLKKMQETRGNIQMEELTNYVQKQVAQQSLVINKKPQNPQVQSSLEFSEDWKKVKLK